MGWILQLHVGFWIALGLSIGLWGKQVLTLKQETIPPETFGQFFRQNVWIGFLLLAGMISGYLL
jgi:4-hydroxybenzoate polyprenyltransferase